MILGYGYESAFLWFGLGQGLIILLCRGSCARRRPAKRQSRRCG
jgi:hypothetical protein